ncbi:lysozyme inhibitor [Salmonella enterica subsp. enterica serovar Havana]|uniref:MliC family protein n=1 Tax=Salmonella enterica TaxID=28901 RepID=UPI00057510D0|nr:MliC family protein [Salmonella enterica]KHP16753.1 lysozyme inhibitor [Salmonella enterica subsp. enterica serovar Havana]
MPMKKIVIMCLPVLLTGCSVYQQFVERMQTDTLEYQCDEKPLTLKQGISASGARYTDGIYVFWSQGESATVYKRDRIVLNNCQLQNPKR